MDGRAWTGRELGARCKRDAADCQRAFAALVNGRAAARRAARKAPVFIGSHRPKSRTRSKALMFLAQLAPASSNRRCAPATSRPPACAHVLRPYRRTNSASQLCDALVECGAVVFGSSGGALMPVGIALFAKLDVVLEGGHARRSLCRLWPGLERTSLSPRGLRGLGSRAPCVRQGLVGAARKRRAPSRSPASAVAALRAAFGVDWRSKLFNRIVADELLPRPS